MTARLKLRPDFTIPLSDDGGALLVRLRAQLAAADAPFIGQILEYHGFLRLPRDRRSLFSPTLNLELRAEPDGVRLHGRFTPHPHVWTGFMAVFGVLLMTGLGGFVYGLAQVMLREPPWALFALPAALLLGAFVYGASFIGQGLSAGEMCALRAFVDRALRDAGRAGI